MKETADTVFVVRIMRSDGSESRSIAYTPEEASIQLEKDKNAPLEFVGRSGRTIKRAPIIDARIEEAPARLFPNLKIN